LDVLSRKALVLLKQARHDKAIEKFKDAKDYYKKLEKEGSTDKIAVTYINICKGLASSYIALNKMGKAWALCEEAFSMIQLLDKNSFASFGHTVENIIDLMNLHISCTKSIQKREKIGVILKNIERIPRDLEEVNNEYWQEVRNRFEQFRPKVLEALVYCYGEVNVREVEHWIKELKKSKKRAAGNKLEASEQYYTEATLINLLATSRSAQQGKIAISLPGKGKEHFAKRHGQSSLKARGKKL
jgi:hypothetical protein